MINLFVNYFDHSEPARRREIEYCFKKNEENELIDNIIVVNRNNLCTYYDFLSQMHKYPDDVNIIANADIYFDETIELANAINKNECYALTRWEFIQGNVISFSQRHGKPSPPEWSQDAWIFRGSIEPVKFSHVKAVNLDRRVTEFIPFQLGIPGCDNKFAAMLKGLRMNVTNPSKTIKAIHVHRSNSRIYPRYQILEGIRPFGLVYQI